MNLRNITIATIACFSAVVFIYFSTSLAKGSTPTIEIEYPIDGQNTNFPAYGIYYSVTITDPDGDLQRVVLQSNSSGTWQTFYDSGELGGVSSHRAHGDNLDWERHPLRTIYWKICAKDSTGWVNETHSFKVGIIVGNVQFVGRGYDTVQTKIIKEPSTGKYYLFAHQYFTDYRSIKVIATTKFPSGQLESTGVYASTLYEPFIYNGKAYLYFSPTDYTNLSYMWYNETAESWQVGDTGIDQTWWTMGADVVYYQGKYHLIVPVSSGSGDYPVSLCHYTSDNPLTGFSLENTIYTSDNDFITNVQAEVLNDTIVVVYRTIQNNRWAIYNGTAWIDKGTIDINSWSFSLVKIPHINALVLLDYDTDSEELLYRVLTNPNGTWSDAFYIFEFDVMMYDGWTPQPGGHANYIDGRFIIVSPASIGDASYWNISILFSPDYTIMTSRGPTIAIKNFNNRPILNITWYTNDIEEDTQTIATIWSNMSGTWQIVGYGNTTIDISAYKGSEWLPGETLYWKIILNEPFPKTTPSYNKSIWSIDKVWYNITLEEDPIEPEEAYYIVNISIPPPKTTHIHPPNGSIAQALAGEEVAWAINVTGIKNIQRIILQSNSSGTWQTFYDSGNLNNVYYYNASGTNINWTRSWRTFFWKICVKNPVGWKNVTLHFSTRYIFGRPQYVHNSYVTLYKNSTNEYYLWVEKDGHIGVVRSTNGIDFMTKPIEDTGITGNRPYTAFTYNNTPYLFYYADNFWTNAHLWYDKNTNTWQTEIGPPPDGETAHSYVIYYDGRYNLISYTGYYISNNPLSSFTLKQRINEIYEPFGMGILKGKLVLLYETGDGDLAWAVYDGENWDLKGIISDVETSSGSLVKDPIHDVLVAVVGLNIGWDEFRIVYYILDDPNGTWIGPFTLHKKVYPQGTHVSSACFIDQRLIFFSLDCDYDKEETFTYMFASPDFACTTGTDEYNRIHFFASANQKHVNSTVIAIKNINDRPILNITWHVGNIGDIETANNVRVWSNMSGTWQSWLVGSDHNTTTIDISAYKGSEWLPGETLYWKIEIIDIGDVPEDVYICDKEVWYMIDLGD